MRPLLDVAAPTKSDDQAKSEKYVLGNIARTEKISSDFDVVFVDSSELDPDFRISGETHPVVAAAASIAKAGAVPIPVTGLHRDAAHSVAALGVMKEYGHSICLRLDSTDVSTAKMSYIAIQEFLKGNDIGAERVYLLLDLQGLFGHDPGAAAAAVNRLLVLLNERVWAGILVGGYGLPEQLSTAVQTNEQAYLPRVEQGVFKLIKRHELQSPAWFADYTVLAPSVVELDFQLISRVLTPRAVYTLEDSWLVVRGGAFSSHPEGYGQYFTIAKEIVALDEFCGSEYCFGDDYIAKRALDLGKSGNPGSWITACVNHHMTFTARNHASLR